MTATIPPNHVVCPRCKGSMLNDFGHAKGPVHCRFCENGHILNPLIDEWRTSTSPARLIELLGGKADERRSRLFVGHCRDEAKRMKRFQHRHHDTGWMRDLAYWAGTDKRHISNKFRCNIIRCLWSNPAIERERVECPECEGDKVGENPYCRCPSCNGNGTIDAPIIDPRWRTSTVLDLARTIRGDGWSDPDEHGWIHTNKPRPGLMPILWDTLQNAGCDDDEIWRHCMSEGPHVAGCWVIEGILGTA